MVAVGALSLAVAGLAGLVEFSLASVNCNDPTVLHLCVDC